MLSAADLPLQCGLARPDMVGVDRLLGVSVHSANGAVEAAEWIRGRPGVFTLDDMLAERFS